MSLCQCRRAWLPSISVILSGLDLGHSHQPFPFREDLLHLAWICCMKTNAIRDEGYEARELSIR